MNFFRRILSSLKPAPQEQIVGYSKQELEKLFSLPLPAFDFPDYPSISSLINVGINAYYSCFLVDLNDMSEFEALVTSNFQKENERSFNSLPVYELKNPLTSFRLIYFISIREFNSATIRLVTNNSEFLLLLSQKKMPVPPPWIAFQGYEATWWGGNMEGAQGYYENNYFFPFFTSLNTNEKQAYYARFNATEEWINRLELMYDDE
jgi:hypothetical protein